MALARGVLGRTSGPSEGTGSGLTRTGGKGTWEEGHFEKSMLGKVRKPIRKRGKSIVSAQEMLGFRFSLLRNTCNLRTIKNFQIYKGKTKLFLKGIRN